MNQSLVSGITGAAPIWNKIMQRVLEETSDIWPKQPDGIVGAQICSITGLLPPEGEGGCPTRFEYFIRGTVPTKVENLKQAVIIDKTTGDLASPDQVDNVEPQEKQVVSDGISTWCLDCPHPEGKTVLVK